MTYCAGWKYGNAVFLIADSAVTRATRPSVGQSSFGQLHRQVREAHVEEGLLKLAPVGNNAAIAYAGNVALAVDILEFLIVNWPVFGGDIDALDRTLTATFGPFNPERKVAFLLAWTSDIGPALAQWESGAGFISRDCDACSIGSIGDFHRDFARNALTQMRQMGVPQEDLLPAMTALVQSFGVHDDLIEYNVGGAVFGLAVGIEGVQWQADTGYLIYSTSGQQPEFVSARVRENALVITSSITRESMAMMNSAVPDWKAWHATWNDRIAKETRVDHFSFVVFIRLEDRLITVVQRIPGQDGPLMRFKFPDGHRLVEMTEALGQVLDAEISQPLKGLPFRLNFLREPAFA